MSKMAKVMEKYRKDAEEHEKACKSDPYYAHCHGGGRVPEPRCEFCQEYDGDRCHREWNNNDDCYYIPERDDKEPDDVCEGYEWNGELEG